MSVQHITLAEVKAACRDAYKVGTLLAQQTDKTLDYGYRVSLNDGSFCFCAIGVVLTPETHKNIEDNRARSSTIRQIPARVLHL